MAPLRSPGTETNFEEAFLSRDGLSGFTETAVVEEESFTSGREFLADGTLWNLLEIDRNYLKRRVQRAGNLNLKQQIEKGHHGQPRETKIMENRAGNRFCFLQSKNQRRKVD